MEVMLADQTRAFLYAALLGAGLGLLYDLLRTIRILLGNGKWLTAGLDLFYCLAAALSFFTLTLLYGQGQVRSYTVAGAVLGAVLYFSGFSTWCWPYWRRWPGFSTACWAEWVKSGKKPCKRQGKSKNGIDFLAAFP